LYFEKGLRPQEIAKQLGLSINTVYKAISKYRSYLKELEKQKVENLNQTEQIQNKQQDDTNKNVEPTANVHNTTTSTEIHHVNENVCERSYRTYRHVNMLSIIWQFSTRMPPIYRNLTLMSTYGNNINGQNLNNGHDNDITVNTVNSMITEVLGKLCECLQQLVTEIKSLKSELIKVLNHGIVQIPARPSSEFVVSESEQKQGKEDSEIPEFLKDNVWVDIIRSKYST